MSASRPLAAAPRHRQQRGFSLLELLVSLGLGVMLCLAFLNILLPHTQGNERLARMIRERSVQRRTLAFLRSELLRADRLQLGDQGPLSPTCNLSGRRGMLHLQTPHGMISYSVGSPPSSIWRGLVLMRCGPAYGLDGEPGDGASQNRVLLDGLTSDGLQVLRKDPLRLQLRLRQQFRLADGSSQEISSSQEMSTAEPASQAIAGGQVVLP